jgi:DNA polymerase-3 subunit epsilon
MFKRSFIKRRAFAFKFCGQSLENAHSAEADTMATYEILKAQLERLDLQNDIKSLSEFSTRKKIADFAGMIALRRIMKSLLWKTQRSKVDKILETEPGYFSWIQNADFLYTLKSTNGD